MYGIFVNENGCVPYAKAIVEGVKTIETRNRNMLKDLVGQRVAIVRTRRNKSPMVLGSAKISSAVYIATGEGMDILRSRTLIPKGSAHDNNGKGKWCYIMTDAQKNDEPYLLPSDAVRHGRSWCEFGKESMA